MNIERDLKERFPDLNEPYSSQEQAAIAALAAALDAQVRVTEARILSLKAGDLLLVRVAQRLSYEHAKNLREEVQRVVPEGVKVAVVEDGMDMEVIRAEPALGMVKP